VRFEEAQDGGFIDMVWPGVCIFEMKRPSEADRLDAHRAQALRYWQRAGTARQAAPPYVVPYHGSQQIRGELGDDYAEWLRRAFGVGLKDYCVYWFRKAHDHLDDGGRAGLVGTNSITQNRARGPSLQWIVENGGVITSAVSTQDWSGEAAVDVSIANWVKRPADPPPEALLDGRVVGAITASLRTTGVDFSAAARLSTNRGRAFQGPMPVGAGFVLSTEQAEVLLSRTDADYSVVVRPYLVGDDIAVDPRQAPRRYVIDFAIRPLEEARAWPAALDILRERVKPERERNATAFDVSIGGFSVVRSWPCDALSPRYPATSPASPKASVSSSPGKTRGRARATS